MALNLSGDDISSALGGGGGPSPSDPIQDAKLLTLENKTRNIDSNLTDATKTEFTNKIIAGEIQTPLSTAVEFRSSQYFDNIGNSGFFLGTGALGNIQINKTPYQGTSDAIMSLSANGTIQKSNSTADTSGNLTAIKFRSTQYYDNIGNSGIFMTPGGSGNIQFDKNTYKGTADAIVSLSANGTIQKTNCIADTSGNLTGQIVSGTQELRSGNHLNQSGTAGIIIDNTANGNVQLSGSSYTTGSSNVMVRLDNNGTIEKTNINIDGPSLNNITNCNILGCTNVASSTINNTSNFFTPNMYLGIQGGGQPTAGIMDLNSGNIINSGDITPVSNNTEDIGNTTNRFRDIYFSGNLNGPTAPPTELVYDLTLTDLVGNGALRDEWFSTLTQSKIFINKLSNQTIADLFITYTRSNPTLTEIKLNGTTTGTTSTQKYVDFRDSGGLPSDYQPNELYNITFDAGVGNTWEMKTITCNFEHSGGGAMYDRLGLQQSSDGVTYTNVSLANFYQSATTTPPWSTTRTSTTDGYIFPTDQTNIANVTYNISSRYIKFYFTSDGSSQKAGWDVRLTASDAFHGSLIIKDVNTYPNTKYVVKGGAYAQNNGNDLELKYESSPSSPLILNFNGSIPLVNFTVPSVGWTQIAQNTSQVSLTGDITGSSLTVSNNINLNGDIYKNGVLFSGGGVNGITSQDNGGGDIEISFTGTDYKTNGYLTVDTNGRIQVQPTVTVSNAEYDAIVLKWSQERSNNNLAIAKIYLPLGVPVGGFNHTIHNVYLALQNATNNTKIIYDVRFIGYQGSTAISEVTINSITNAVEIYNAGSTAHPNNVPSTNLKQHITRHFTSDYNFLNYPSFNITSVPRVAVQNPSNWSEGDPFALTFGFNGGAPLASFYISTLYGSQNGFTNVSTNSSAIPAGYTEIF